MRCNTKKKKERKEVGEEDEKEGEKQARQQTKGSPTQGNGGWGSGLMMMKRTGRAGWIVMANRSVGLRCKKTGGFLSSFFFFFSPLLFSLSLKPKASLHHRLCSILTQPITFYVLGGLDRG